MQRDWRLMPDAGGSLQIKYSAPGVWVGLTKEHVLMRDTKMELEGPTLVWINYLIKVCKEGLKSE